MKRYAYYPGCSLESLAKAYDASAKEVARALDLELKEIEDWNCCGATAYFPVDELLAYTLVARNLAIAEKTGLTDFVAPCSACFKNAYYTNKYLQNDPDLADHINFALEEDELHVDGKLRVRHLIEVILEDVGLDEIRKKTTFPLNHVRVAPYYGCQLLRPKPPILRRIVVCHRRRAAALHIQNPLLRRLADHNKPQGCLAHGSRFVERSG